MLDWLLQFDRTAFEWVNQGLSNPLFDVVLPWCRERWFWAPLYLFVLAFVFLNLERRTAWLVAAGLVLSVGLADFTSSTLVKKNVQRLRPCNDPSLEVNLRASGCGGGYSFTSSHAANHFAVAVFLSGVFAGRRRWIRPALLGWAALIAFSQVYVGVHFPLDVICGALLGSAMGWWTWQTWRRRLQLPDFQ